MKNKSIIGITILCCLVLTACGHKHTWIEANCTEPKTCAECGETEGKALGHSWADATCTEPKTCSVCGKTEGEALGHTEGDWAVVEEPTPDSCGIEEQRCTVCGKTLKKNEHLYYYDISESEVKYYDEVLNIYNSLKAIHGYPESFELIGAVCSNEERIVINISYKAVSKTQKDYFWKLIDEDEIKNTFGQEHYIGIYAGGRMRASIEELDLEEIEYYENVAYEPELIPAENITVN